ncbi:MAG: AgmX/PglI C-terminal domain-containing protein [Pseudomonadota bacterium]
MASASMTAYQAYYREYQLPWSVISDEQEQKFRKILTTTLIIMLVLSVVWPFLPTPQPDPSEVVEIEQRFAQLILEERELPPPPPPRVEEEQPEPEPIEEAEPEPVVQETPEPVVEPEPVAEPEPDPTPAARERASVAGLLPFSDDLAALRDNSVVDQVAGSQELTGAVGAAERNERSLITSNVGAASGGINTAALSRNTGGTGLSGRNTTKVDTPVAAIGNGGSTEADVQRAGASNRGSRSREEIEMVFDRNKGAIYALYNRALRQDPTLEGKLVLRLTISPDGVVTACEIESSELNDPDLERKLVQRVKLFRFEARDVEAITTTKPIDFFPA